MDRILWHTSKTDATMRVVAMVVRGVEGAPFHTVQLPVIIDSALFQPNTALGKSFWDEREILGFLRNFPVGKRSS